MKSSRRQRLVQFTEKSEKVQSGRGRRPVIVTKWQSEIKHMKKTGPFTAIVKIRQKIKSSRRRRLVPFTEIVKKMKKSNLAEEEDRSIHCNSEN